MLQILQGVVYTSSSRITAVAVMKANTGNSTVLAPRMRVKLFEESVGTSFGFLMHIVIEEDLVKGKGEGGSGVGACVHAPSQIWVSVQTQIWNTVPASLLLGSLTRPDARYRAASLSSSLVDAPRALDNEGRLVISSPHLDRLTKVLDHTIWPTRARDLSKYSIFGTSLHFTCHYSRR